MKKTLSKKTISKPPPEEYGGLIGGIAELLETARHSAARAFVPKKNFSCASSANNIAPINNAPLGAY
jgi:hypothetical protein